MSFLDFLPIPTPIKTALAFVPMLFHAVDGGHPDEWVFEHLPERLKGTATLEEFNDVITSGKAFVKACISFHSL